MKNPFRKPAAIVESGNIPIRMSMMVVCCNCGRAMRPNGSAGPIVAPGGVLDRVALQNAGDSAFFASKEEADKQARVLGWKVEDGNHRCRECKIEDTPRRGMYVDLRDFGL